jgi:mRNA-degrading endonuclease toxin of MazEF toxin-antitoxin module
VAKRGDVLLLKRRLGFGGGRGQDRVVVLQHDALNAVLDTTIVAPLDLERAGDADDPTLVEVSATEAGGRETHYAMLTQLFSVTFERLEAGAVGRLSAETLAQLEGVLGAVLGIELARED